VDDFLLRFCRRIAARPYGPLAFRFYLQPLVAIIYATRDGLADARGGKPAYFWALFSEAAQRRRLLQEGWRSVGKVLIFAAVVDVVYQAMVLRTFHPLDTMIVAALLALVPYVLVRGPINRIAKWIRRRSATRKRAA